MNHHFVSNRTQFHHQPQENISIPGIQLGAKIGQGQFSTLYLASKGNEQLAVKIFEQVNGESKESLILRVRREASILAILNQSNIVKVLKIGDFAGFSYLLMEYVQGTNLSAYLAQKPLPERVVLKVAIQVAKALHEVHRNGIVHRDIKSQNIMIDSSGNIKLIDFGLALHQTFIKKIHETLGTLLYTSPEQTGLMKRIPDHRSDLYSTGIVLFECCTGVTPFASRNMGEVIHRHAFEIAEPVHKGNPLISKGLSEIISKLLSKEPDDRFQSAIGLLEDLNQVSTFTHEIQAGKNPTLDLAKARMPWLQDFSIIGRQDLLQQFNGSKAEFARTETQSLNQTSNSICIVTGEKGIGKTRLVQEFLANLQPPLTSLIVIKGSLEARNNICSIPLQPVRQALKTFDQLIKMCATANLLFPVPNSQIFDYLNVIISEVSFHPQIFFELLKLLNKSGSVILLFEDMEVLDEGSFQFLLSLIPLRKKYSLHLFCVCQNDSEFAKTRIRLILAQVNHEEFSNDNCLNFKIKNFDFSETRDLIFQRLGGESNPTLEPIPSSKNRNGAESISQEVWQKIWDRTTGNPLATILFVETMITHGALYFFQGKWVLDTEELASLKLPELLIDFIYARINQLSHSTLHVLTLAAVYRLPFTEQLLLDLEQTGNTKEKIELALEEAILFGLIERNSAGQYIFTHQSIAKALVIKLEPKKLACIHQVVGEVLEKNQNENSHDNIFDIIEHLNSGIKECSSEKIFRLNFLAGKKALENFSDEKAEMYFHESLKSGYVPKVHDFLEFEELYADLCIRTGQITEGLQHLKRIYDYAISIEDRVRIKSYDLWVTNSHSESCLSSPPNTLKIIFSLIWKSLMIGFPLLAQRLFKIKHPQPLIDFKMVNHLRLNSLLIGRRKTFLFLSLLVFPFLKTLELSAILAELYIFHALGAALRGRKEISLSCASYANFIATSSGDTRVLIKCQMLQIVCQILVGNDKHAQDLFDSLFKKRSYHFCGALGLITMNYEFSSLLFRGLGNKLISSIQEMKLIWTSRLGLPNLDAFEQRDPGDFSILGSKGSEGNPKGKDTGGFDEGKLPFFYCSVFLVGAYGILGRNMEAREYDGKLIRHLRHLKQNNLWYGTFLINRLLLAIEEAEIGEPANEIVKEYENLLRRTKFDQFHVGGFLICKSYLRLRQWEAILNKESQDSLHAYSAMKDYKRAFTDLEHLSSSSCHQGHLLVLKGCYFFHKNNYSDAIRKFNQAEELAHQSENLWNQFEIYFYLGMIYLRQKNQTASLHFSELALKISTDQGWVGKSEMIYRVFDLRDSNSNKKTNRTPGLLSQSSRIPSPSDHRLFMLERKLNSLHQLSLAFSDFIEPKNQAQIALKEIIHLLSAERGLLFVPSFGTNTNGPSLQMDANLNLVVACDLQGNELEDLKDFSRSVIDRVRISQKPVLLCGNTETDALECKSIFAHNLRSIISVPMLTKDRLIGVIYLDSRIANGIFSEQDIDILVALGMHIAVALEASRSARLEFERSLLAKDLELVGAVQSLFLPAGTYYALDQLHFSVYYQPANQSGGDWWWYETLPDGSTLLLIGDVTGHGAGSAMVVSSVASCFKTFRVLHETLDMNLFFQTLNQNLISIGNSMYWMSLMAILIQPKTDELKLWSAGSPPLLIYRKTGPLKGTVEKIRTLSNFIGSSELSIASSKTTFTRGDELLAFTDGCFEFPTQKHRSFGIKRLTNLFLETRNLGVRETTEQISNRLSIQKKGTYFDDDMTLIVAARH